jgi:polysaccharide biosynthesis protein PslG
MTGEGRAVGRGRSVWPAVVATAVTLILAAPAQSPAAANGFFGVTSTFQPDTADLSRMGQAHVGNLRLPFGWEELEPIPGTYNFSNFDRIVAGAAAQGIPVRPFIFGTPPWARDCTGVPAFYCDRVTPMRSALGAQRWPLLWQALASRYGTHGSFWSDNTDAYSPPYDPITHWQLWNEANSATYMRPKPTPKAYYQLLLSGSRALHQADPKAKVLLAGLFGTPPNGITMWRFLDRLYRFKGVRGLFSGVALHPYSPNIKFLRFQLQKARQVLRLRHAKRTPIYLTEIGWGSGRGNSGLYKGTRGQARMLRAAFKFSRKNRKQYRLAGVDWFSWRDIPANMSGNCDICTSFGLLNLDHSPKPALTAFTAFTGGT